MINFFNIRPNKYKNLFIYKCERLISSQLKILLHKCIRKNFLEKVSGRVIYPKGTTDYEKFCNGFFYKSLIDEKDNNKYILYLLWVMLKYK